MNLNMEQFLTWHCQVDYGDVTYDLDARALTPVEAVEKVQSQWQTYIDEANGIASSEEADD